MKLQLARLPRLVKERRSSAILGVAVIAMLWGGIGLKYLDDVRADRREAAQIDENFAMVFEENVLRSIGEIDKALLYLRRSIETRKATTDYSTIVNTTDVLSEIIVQVAIIDAQGIMRASNAGPQPAPPIDLSDREHFRFHLHSKTDQLFISKPLVGRASHRWSVQFTRAFHNSDGSFAGVVVASLDPEHLTKFYNKINLGSSVSIALIGDDGVVRSSGGRAGGFALGQNLSATPFFAHARQNTTFEDAPHGQLVTFRRVRGQPLWVSVSKGLDEVYGGSSAALKQNSAVGVLLTLVVLFAMEKLLRTEGRVRQKAEHLQLTLENMSQGIMLVTRDLDIPVINSRCAELLGLPPEFIGHPPRFDELMAHLSRAGSGHERRPREDAPKLEPTVDSSVSERVLADGTVLEVRSVPLAGGGLVQTVTDITKRREAEQRVARLASEDPLTGLPNRRLFHSALEELSLAIPAGTAGWAFAVLFIDLDRFKVVNDTLGHRIGDLLLIEVGGRLKLEIGGDDMLVRLGGDEFAIVVRTGASRAAVADLARGILDAVGRPYRIDGYQVRTGASIGIAVAPDDGHSVDDLLVAADLALYASKSTRRGTFTFYRPEMSAELKDRRVIETDLRSAIERNELELYYQPIIDMRHSRMTGFEALARWRHPSKGLIPPSLFIPVAEETGLIFPIGEWALSEACRTAAQWPGELKIAVNISPVQLQASHFLDRFTEVLSRSGLAPHRLEVEFTERIMLENNDRTLDLFERLKRLGVRTAMDDFGTGYSSLSYLRTFPFDKVKIDRSFVSDLAGGGDHAVIVQAIVNIARALGMTVTAEGVETEYQRDYLAALGCDEAQGHIYSQAVPTDMVDSVLTGWNGNKVRVA